MQTVESDGLTSRGLHHSVLAVVAVSVHAPPPPFPSTYVLDLTFSGFLLSQRL